VYQDF